MAGVNQYRRRWSTQPQYRRSRTATLGRGVPILLLVSLLAVTLYIFGIVGPDARRRGAVPTLAATLVPPPAALVMPTTMGNVEPFGTLPPVAPITDGAPPPLIYKLSGPLTGGAPRADVFNITWPPPSAAQVDELARRLGLTGPVRQPKAGMYTVDGNGRLAVDAKATVYAPPSAAATTTNNLPDDRTAISNARGWLAARDLLPADVGPATVRRDSDTLDVVFHPKALPDILSDTPGIRVRVGPGNVVREVERAWPSQLLPGAYDLISLDDAWQQAQERGMVDLRPPAGLAVPPNATALVNDVSLAYAFASDKNGRDFLQPVYLFSGTVAIPGQPAGADIRIAVPAIRNVRQAAG